MNYIPEMDFLVFDNKESLTWLRPLNGNTCTIPEALRLSTLACINAVSSTEKNESYWIFPQSSMNGTTPIPGDVLIDSGGVRWTISDVLNMRSTSCWKCSAVNLMARWNLEDTVDQYRPVWDVDEDGVPFPNYQLWRPGILAKFVPLENERQMEIHIPDPTVRLRYRDCLMTSDNRAFRVLEYHPSATWMELSKVLTEIVKR